VRFLGIDYGTKRIGLAVGDSEGTPALPLDEVASRGRPADDAVLILPYVREYEITALVIGLPLNMDGSEGRQAEITRTFGNALSRIAGCPVHYWDERLTTRAAAERLQSQGLSRAKRRSRRDRVAAQIILQEFLEEGGTG
jgi:putative Holliday junction resolvase